jgi:hypothetical protein
MNRITTVRIKGAKWEALASRASTEPISEGISTLVTEPLGRRSLGGGNSKVILLDLAVRHFRDLQLTTTEAKRLGIALRRCLNGEAVDVGPVGSTGRTFNFRRKANAIAIRVGQGCMRLPLDAAKALIESLQGVVSPGRFANSG